MRIDPEVQNLRELGSLAARNGQIARLKPPRVGLEGWGDDAKMN